MDSGGGWQHARLMAVLEIITALILAVQNDDNVVLNRRWK
jgi:hypothetical protein